MSCWWAWAFHIHHIDRQLETVECEVYFLFTILQSNYAQWSSDTKTVKKNLASPSYHMCAWRIKIFPEFGVMMILSKAHKAGHIIAGTKETGVTSKWAVDRTLNRGKGFSWVSISTMKTKLFYIQFGRGGHEIWESYTWSSSLIFPYCHPWVMSIKSNVLYGS